MEVVNYIAIRRAYSLVRQQQKASERLPFEELSILAHLDMLGVPVKTSGIASYQHALRPTTTHRTNRLADMGYIKRAAGQEDKRNIVCTISKLGKQCLQQLAEATRLQLAEGSVLSRISTRRLCRYIDAMGTNYSSASDLILVSMFEYGDEVSVGNLVGGLGLLQPTVSMALSQLAKEKLISRKSPGLASSTFTLVAAGKKRAQALREGIEEIIVRRG